jgi:hypothetical protein
MKSLNIFSQLIEQKWHTAVSLSYVIFITFDTSPPALTKGMDSSRKSPLVTCAATHAPLVAPLHRT